MGSKAVLLDQKLRKQKNVWMPSSGVVAEPASEPLASRFECSWTDTGGSDDVVGHLRLLGGL